MKNQQMNQDLSPEELEARRDEMKQFYENSVPYLEAQAKYEKLLTDVEESRYRRATMQMQYASMMASTQGSDFDIDKDDDDTKQGSISKPLAQEPAGDKKLKKG